MSVNQYLIVRFDSVNNPTVANENIALQHHGIIGQKWGIRRYQNPDGTLTPEGRIRYRVAEKNSANYKTVGNRIVKTVGGGFLGSVVGVGGTIAALKPWTAVGKAALSEIGVLTFADGAALTGAAVGLGALAVTGLVQGIHAAKVRRGLNFVNKYETAYKKTTGGAG